MPLYGYGRVDWPAHAQRYNLIQTAVPSGNASGNSDLPWSNRRFSGTQLANQVNLGLGEASELGANGLFQIHYTIKSKA